MKKIVIAILSILLAVNCCPQTVVLAAGKKTGAKGNRHNRQAGHGKKEKNDFYCSRSSGKGDFFQRKTGAGFLSHKGQTDFRYIRRAYGHSGI